MKKLFASITASFLLLISFSPLAVAQSNPFDTLDIIEDKLGESDIEIIDYDDNRGTQGWGSLNAELIELLSGVGNNLGEIQDDILSDKEPGDTTITRDDVKALVEERFLERLDEGPEIMPSLFGNFSFAETSAILEANAGSLDDLVQTLNSENQAVASNTVRLYIEDATSSIIAELRFSGESQVNQALLTVAEAFRNIAGALAVLFIVISGIQMVMAGGDETKITEQRKSIVYALVGLVAIVLIERMIAIVYGVPGAERGIQIADVGQRFSNEVLGLVAFIKGLVGSVAVAMIMIAGFRTIFSAGEEDQIIKQRRAITWTVVGIILIILNQVIIENIFILPSAREIQDSLAGVPIESQVSITAGNVSAIIVTLGQFANFLLTFVGVLALAALFYGAGLMVANYGNDELIEKAKKIIRNAIIGIMVIIASFALINTIII